MSYTALDSIQWGGVPKIGVSFGYDSRRSGSAMQYSTPLEITTLSHMESCGVRSMPAS